ncbi:hypothetical protein L596_020039 [Steinernema carpocapsae]|uniref:non-specific serine/threonine protein kinase n=1 Tax=Steinernema carpocapsae TaxID=34508 RepID=A0A4U5MSD9_STECR|nr:hypothetical protein L596_020039 [Steinernema carpocapsae]
MNAGNTPQLCANEEGGRSGDKTGEDKTKTTEEHLKSPASGLAGKTKTTQETKTQADSKNKNCEPKKRSKKKYGRSAPQMIPNKTMLMKKFEVVRMIGGGGFGQIYGALDMDKEQLVAIKVEPSDHDPGRMVLEQKVLATLKGKSFIPAILGSGTFDAKFNFIVMELLGKNLSELRRRQPSRRLSLASVFRVGQQATTALRTLHEAGYIHRDVKPSNMCIGLNEKSRQIFLVDFGMCRQFRNPKGEKRRPRRSPGFRGTVKYASLNVHELKEQSVVDDFISLYYGLIELLTGSLPWRTRHDVNEVAKCKRQMKLEDLGFEWPLAFKTFYPLLTAYDSAKDELLDYDRIMDICTKCLPEGVDEKTPYDWDSSSKKRKKKNDPSVSCDAGTQ